MSKIYYANIALESANSFRQLSKVFTDKLGKDVEVAKEIAAHDQGGMIASPTLLSLSIELYLKGMIMIFPRIKVPETHDLSALYKKLPQGLRSAMEDYYNYLNSTINPTDTSALIVALHPHTVTDEEFDEWLKINPLVSEKNKVRTIEAVLKRSKDMFMTWRYIYEKKNHIQLYSYEYTRLGFIADSLRYHLEEMINQLKTNPYINPPKP